MSAQIAHSAITASAEFNFTSSDGLKVVCFRWDSHGPTRGVVQIAHGSGEHIGRYRETIEVLNSAGLTVYGNDHRGHGRTAPDAAHMGDFGEGGFDLLVEDMFRLSRIAKSDNPGVPFILLGHSMGSFAAQQYVFDRSHEIDGLILSGSGALDGLAASTSLASSHTNVLNQKFEPARTPFDWLSRDPVVVDAFISDPLCFSELQPASLASFLSAAPRLSNPISLSKIRDDLSIYLFSGSEDPIGQQLDGVELLIQRYEKAGIYDVSHDFYRGGRHEMLNDINREEVRERLLAWISSILEATGYAARGWGTWISITEGDTMTTENIFSGIKVVDLSSFVAAPGAAVILSDFGADVIKVEPPSGDTWRIGNHIPPQPAAKDPYQWHLNNRNKRGLALDLKSPSAQPILEKLVKWADVLIVNTPHPARKRLKLEYEDVVQWNPRLIYADLTGFGDKGPDANLPGFDITSYWARSGLLSMTRDAGAPPTWPVGGSGDNATAVGLYSAIVTALYRRERTGKGSHVTTSLLAEGVWSASVSIQAALSGAKFYGLHDRKNPASAALNVYRASDETWFVLIIGPDKLKAVAQAIGREDLLTDPRFSDPKKLMENMPQLTAILDEVFGAQPMAHWYEVFSGLHVTFGAVRGPQEVINDPQLKANDIVIPIEGAGDKITSTISSPFQVHGVTKVSARRAPDLGEHNEQILEELGFDAKQIDALLASGAVHKPREAAIKGGA